MEQKNIRYFKVNSLPSELCPNAIYYVPNGNGSDLDEYVTDKYGNARKVRSISPLEVNVNGVTSEVTELVFLNSNGVTFGISDNTITASAAGGGGADFILGNANGLTFGTLGSTVTGSYTMPTDYISSNQSSLFQLTANNSLSLGTDYTSHTHSQYINTSQSSAFLTSQTQQPFVLSGTNGSSTFNTLSLGTVNGLTLYLTNGSLAGSYTDGGGAGADGLNRISAGSQIAGVTQTVVFSNSNNVSFGMSNNSVVTASVSYSQPTDYVSTAQSSLFQFSSQMTDYVQTAYTTHSHTEYVNTSVSSLFQATSDNSLSLGTNYTTHTHSQYVNTSQSSLFQQTSLMTNYLGTDYTSHTHSQYVNTSQSSLFEQSSHTTIFLTTQSGQAFSASGGSSTFQTLPFVNSNGFTFSNTNGSIRASYSVPTDYISSNQSSLFALTANDSLSLGTAYTSHTHSQYLNTSQSSLFEQSSHTTVFLTTQSGQAYSAGNGSNTFQTLSVADSNGVSFSTGTQGLYATVRTNYAASDHSHGNPTLALTNISGTTASNSAGFTLSLSAPAGGGGADGYNILAAGTQTATTAGTVVLSNSNGISFGMSNSSIITASYTVPTDYVSTAQSSLFYLTANSSLFELSSHTTVFLTTQSGQAFSAGAASSVFQTLSFQDSNGVSFSNNAGGIRVSHALQFTSNTSAITASALNTSQSSLFQHTSATSAITSNALNTSQSSLFQHTSATSAITSNALNTSVARIQGIIASNTTYTSGSVSYRDFNGISFQSTTGQAIQITHDLQYTSNTSAITANALHTSQSSLFQHTSATSAITSNALNTSQSSLFQHTSATSAITSNALNTSASRVINILAATNNTGGGTASLSSNVSFSNANAVSFYTSAGGAIVASVNTSYAASNHSHGNPTLALTNISGTTASNSAGLTLSLSAAAPGGGGGLAIANSQTTYTSGTAHFSGAGAITIASTTGQSFQISVPATSSLSATGIVSISTNGSTVSIGASQSNQIMTMYATSNTTQSSTGTQNASSMIFVGAGAASVGISNGSVVISAPNAGAGNVTISAGTASAGLASLVFSNSNGVSFGLNGSTITASAAGGGGGIALANSQTTYTSGTAHLSGAGAISVISTTGQSYILSAPGSSSISGTGQVSISVNGSTISIGVPEHEHRSFYNPYGDTPRVVGQVGQGTLNINPNDFPRISFDRVYMPINNTNSSNSSGSHTLSFWIGIYTRDVSTLSLLASASQTYALTHSGTVGSYSLYSGMRHLSIGFSSSLEEGLYYVGVISRTTSGGTNGSYSQVLASNLNTNFLGHFGSSHNTTMQFRPGIGVYSATTSGMPASIAFSQLRGSDSAAQRPPILIFANSTI